MGWTIEPNTNVTATTEDGKYKVIFGSRDGLPTTAYTIQYEEGSSCGKFVVNQTGNAEPPSPTCNPCRDCLGQVGVDFVITNNHGSTIKINPGVKLKVNKSPYTGSFDYCAPKVGGVYVPIEITNGGTVTIEHNEMEFVEESTIVIPGEWECLGEEASFMDGQPIEGAYVYDVNGMRDISCTISPSTFTAGTPDSPIRYEVTIP